MVKDSSEKVLNKQQLEAVKFGQGPLLIIAGAGTGKTTVITERIKYLIASGLAKPQEILALTFTEKAAREMEERVDLAMPYGYTEMWISTFHSFCDRILRRECLAIGLDPGYKLMTGSEMVQFLIKNLFKMKLGYFRPLGNPTKFVDGLLNHFSRLKDEDISPAQYLKWTKDKDANYKELSEAFRTYEELKIKEGLMDFGDLITNTLALFRQRPKILKQYQGQFSYFLVDEFQDTNIAQNELVILLAGDKANLTVVADDDQSIYKWRGAAVSNVIQFRKTYPKAKIVVLTTNYRSTQEILDRAYGLVQYNNPDRLEVKENIDKKLEAVQKGIGQKIKFIHADRVENEASQVALEIKSLLQKNHEPKDIAILVRANNHAEPFARALAQQGIPYQFLGPGQLFRQPEVKDLIAYLRVLYNFEDSVSLYRVLSMDIFQIFPRDLAAINNFARRFNKSLFEACEMIDKIFVAPQTREKISSFVKMVHRHLGFLTKESAGQILYYFLADTGLLQKIADYKTTTEEKKAQNISRFFDRLKTYEVDHEEGSVPAVADWLNLCFNLGESPLASNTDWTEENRVNLLTVHSSKGLEFPVVFLVNLVAARFPTRERHEQIPIADDLIKEILPEGDSHMEEERRLFYVGMTRAKDRLYFSAADYYGDGKREKQISPFVIEAIGEKDYQKQEEKEKLTQAAKQLTIFDWQKTETIESENKNIGPKINYLSYSQIESFNNCPLQYRYRYIQRIPIAPSAPASFGDSIHKALRDFYQQVMAGKISERENLLSALERNWSPLGYSSKAHEQRMKKEGERMLSNFYDQDFLKSKSRPVSLEQMFTIAVSPDLKIGGKIDRVDPAGAGLEIIDYKTGKVADQRTVDNSLQLTVYALAAADKNIFGKDPKDVILTLHFLETGEKKRTTRTREELERVKADISAKAQEISKSSFRPKPGPLCDFCDFKIICQAWR